MKNIRLCLDGDLRSAFNEVNNWALSIAYLYRSPKTASTGSSTTPNNYIYLSFVATASATTATVTASSNHPPENSKVVTNAEIASQN